MAHNVTLVFLNIYDETATTPSNGSTVHLFDLNQNPSVDTPFFTGTTSGATVIVPGLIIGHAYNAQITDSNTTVVTGFVVTGSTVVVDYLIRQSAAPVVSGTASPSPILALYSGSVFNNNNWTPIAFSNAGYPLVDASLPSFSGMIGTGATASRFSNGSFALAPPSSVPSTFDLLCLKATFIHGISGMPYNKTSEILVQTAVGPSSGVLVNSYGQGESHKYLANDALTFDNVGSNNIQAILKETAISYFSPSQLTPVGSTILVSPLVSIKSDALAVYPVSYNMWYHIELIAIKNPFAP